MSTKIKAYRVRYFNGDVDLIHGVRYKIDTKGNLKIYSDDDTKPSFIAVRGLWGSVEEL